MKKKDLEGQTIVHREYGMGTIDHFKRISVKTVNIIEIIERYPQIEMVNLIGGGNRNGKMVYSTPKYFIHSKYCGTSERMEIRGLTAKDFNTAAEYTDFIRMIGAQKVPSAGKAFRSQISLQFMAVKFPEHNEIVYFEFPKMMISGGHFPQDQQVILSMKKDLVYSKKRRDVVKQLSEMKCMTVKCRECEREMQLSVQQQIEYIKAGNTPALRCKACKEKRMLRRLKEKQYRDNLKNFNYYRALMQQGGSRAVDAKKHRAHNTDGMSVY